ncbi:RAB6A-GEF complex partner protein 2 [Schistosoma japonicum]|nr:RAB6A-GEF complex partner protein 2 [Schistosoma japonicum]KAH8870812.1 RAB6A-GEF complex partner protein 2 [Schistosoma japonicum]
MSSSHTQSLNLVGKLDRLLYSGGDLVNCEVNFFMNSEKTAKEEDKSVVGIVGCIIGQCKLENKQLTTQNQTSPKSLSFSTSDWKYSSNFNCTFSCSCFECLYCVYSADLAATYHSQQLQEKWPKNRFKSNESNGSKNSYSGNRSTILTNMLCPTDQLYFKVWIFIITSKIDAVPSFTSTLESKSQLICIIPMHVKSTPDDVAKGSGYHLHPRLFNTLFTFAVKLSAYLSYNLSPSVRGTLFKFAYKVVVTVQVKYSNSESKTHIVQLPLRVLPSSTMYHSLRFQECDDMKGKFSRDMLNPFWIPDTRDKNSYFNFGFDGGFSKQTQKSITSLFEEKEVHTTKSAGQIYSALSHIVSQSENPDCSKHSSEDSNKVFVYPNSHSELIDLLARSPPANFVISTPRGHVGRLSFQRTLYCLDDEIRGYFNFNDAVVKCRNCVIRLESEERFMLHHENPFLLPGCKIKSRKNEIQNYSIGCLPLTKIGQPLCTNFQPLGVTQYTTWTDIKLNCISKLILPFTLPIPTNITPQFHSVSLTSPFISLDYRWRLHLEFELLSDSSKNDLSDHFNGKSCVKKSYGTIWTLPCNLKTEKFLWNIPIQLVHSNTSVIDSFGDAVKHST